MVVETDSDTLKIRALCDQIKMLEQLLGQKQVKIEFLEKIIELTEEDLKIDIKKRKYLTLLWFWNHPDLIKTSLNKLYDPRCWRE